MKKILISGGSGYLGSHLVRYYLDKGYEVYSLARNEFRQWQLKQKYPQVNIIIGDVRYFDSNISFDAIINCAALKHVAFAEQFKDEALEINIDGNDNLIEFAKEKRIKDYIFISSDKAINPSCYYGETKKISEKHTLDAGYKIARFGNFFGSTGSVIQIWLEKLLRGDNKIKIHHPEARRYFVEVNDACEKIDILLNDKESKEMIYAGAKAWMKDVAKAINPDCEIEYTKLLLGEKIIEEMAEDLTEDMFMTYTVDDLRDIFRRWAAEEVGIIIE